MRKQERGDSTFSHPHDETVTVFVNFNDDVLNPMDALSQALRIQKLNLPNDLKRTELHPFLVFIKFECFRRLETFQFYTLPFFSSYQE